MEDKQQRNLRNYHHQARLLLTERERDHLHDMLKEYQKYHNARQFISDLRSILNTPAKMDLLREIRNLVPPAYLHEFDSLAPYDRMAHPMAMPFMQDAPVFKRSPSWHGRAYERAFDTQSEDLDMSHYVSTGPRVLTITNKNEDLGFTIKGGSEQGTPVSVSRVERGSEAEKNGLTVGDEILEVNNINFEEIAISSAIRVLQGSARLRMTVQHNPALVQQSQRRQSKEKTKWFDTYSRAKGPPAGLNTSPPGFNRERKVVIQLDEKHRFIGFNIRGGSEYGLGIFVSKTDRGGMAEFHKIQVGDQILSVNGTSCENIPHAAAVDLIRGQKRLVLVIRSMGPDTLNQSQSKSHRSQSTTPSMIAGLPSQQQQKSPPFPNGPVPPIPKQNKDWLTRAQPHGGVQRLDARDMKKQSPGENAPIIMSARQSNQGGPHLSNTTITDHLPSRPPSAQSQLSTQRTQPYPHPPSQPHPQSYPQSHPQPHPQAHTQQQQLRQSPPHRRGGDSGGKEKKRGLGRSLSVKHPGERKLPVMEESPKSKPVKVKRNKTFRALFGLKPKVKAHEKEHHQGDRSPEREILPPSPKKDPEEEILAESFEEDLARVDPIGQEAGAHEEDIGVVMEKEGKRHRKGKSKMTGIIASFRKTRPEGLVKKRHNTVLPPDEEQERPPSADRPGSATSWASRKDSLGESLSNSSHGSLGKQKGAFMAGAGTQIMHVHASQASQMPILTEAIKKTLSDDEATAVHRHIKRYHTEGDIDSLVTPLLAILDKPEKVVLLREVRGVIAPLDLAVFDSMVSKRELEARNYLNAKSGSVSPRLSYDRKLLPVDQHESNQPGTSNNYEKEMEKQKRHQNELERLRKQRQEEVRQATLTATGRSLDDPSPYGQLGYPANQTRHGSFDTYSYGERRDQAPQSFSTFKGVASGGSGGGSPASSISDGSLSKKTAKRVLINAAPQIIRTNSAGDDVSPRSEEGEYGGQDEGDGVQNNVFEDRLERGKYDRGSGWDPYETIPVSRLGDENQDSPKIQNNEFAGRRQLNQDSGARNMSNFDPPYATIKVNPLMDNATDTTDANESDHDSEDSDYSISKKNGMYPIMGSDPEENYDNRGTSSPPKSTTKAHKLSPIPASPPSPRIIEPTPPSSPLAASQNLDALLQVRPNPVLTPNRDGTNSNRSSGSSSDDPIYAQVNKAAAKTPGNFLDVRDSVDSASESESSAKRVSFSEFNGSPKPPRKGILKNSFNRNERPTVPIRNPQLYLDDDDDDEPSPLKEIVRSRQGKSPIKPAARRRIDGFPGREIFEFELSKSQSSLGLSLTGGKDYKNQPYVKVDRIYPGGAVADDGNLTSGCVLVGVDGVSLLDVSHHQAMEIIRSAYNDKSKKTMQIEFMDAI